MTTKAFINLAVKDLGKTKDFFAKLGFSYNPQFTDDKAACMIINEDCAVMLLKEEFFKTFTEKDLVDSHTSTEVLTAITVDSRESVDKMMDIALTSGAGESGDPREHGFMYGRAFSDPDGHIWEVLWMDMNAFTQQAKQEKAAPG